MNNQTEQYIILKPIAERFNRIAQEMSDDDIRNIIKSELREQIGKVDFSSVVQECIDNYFEDDENVLSISKMLKQSISDRFKG